MRKTVLVTGCSGGLGKLLAESLSKRGCLVYAGIRSSEDVERFKKLWPASIPLPRPIKLDITDDSECQRAVKEILEKEGRIDVLINSAGITISGPAEQFTAKDYLDILNTNTVGAFRLIRELVPSMRSLGGGKIINITSLNGRVALPNFALYSSSKFALEGLGLALRCELKKAGISVTNVEPGAIEREDASPKRLYHQPAREKFRLVKFLMPLLKGEEVVEAVEQIIESVNPPSQVILGRDSQITTFLQRFLPQSFWDDLLSFVWKK